MIVNCKIDLSKIDNSKLFKSDKTGSIYLDCAILLRDDEDQYGNRGMIVQEITKEEREAGKKGNILGNVKVFEQKSASLKEGDLPWQQPGILQTPWPNQKPEVPAQPDENGVPF